MKKIPILCALILMLFTVHSQGQTTVTNELIIKSLAKNNASTRVMVHDSITKRTGFVTKASLGTNLTKVVTPTDITVESSTGVDVALPLVTNTNAGLASPASKVKLDGIAEGATANQTDAYLLSRTNHTGTQDVGTITGLETVLNAKENTANKQNSLTVDGTGTKFPTVDAVKEAIDRIDSAIDPNSYVVVNNGYTQSGQTLTVNANWEWKISSIDYTNLATIPITIPLTSSGLFRIDIIVLNTSNTAVRIQGVAVSSNPVSPTVPANTLQIAFVTVNSTTATPVTPTPKNQVSQFLRDGQVTYAPSENIVYDALVLKEPNIAAGTISQYWRGDKTWQVIDKNSIGLGNVDNTSDINKPISTATQTAINAVVAKQYKTYFINTSTGNNTTGVYEDSSKPYATIDYVLALPSYQGGTIYLQNERGTFPLNGLLPRYDLIIKSDVVVTLDLSANNNNGLASTGGYGQNVNLTFDFPLGTLRNERSGGSGWSYSDPTGFLPGSNFTVNVKEVYNNSSGLQITKLKAIKVSAKNGIMREVRDDIHLREFVCLGDYSFLASHIVNNAKIYIDLISGTGSFDLSGNLEIGDISTTNPSSMRGDASASGKTNTIRFVNSNISTTEGVSIGGTYGGQTVITGNIRSCSKVNASIIENTFNDLKLLNFSCDLGIGTLRVWNGDLAIENSSIKSTNTPIVFSNAGSGKISLKNSTIELVNALPLITGGAGEARTVKVAGISTNASAISDQINTGVTVTQFTNY